MTSTKLHFCILTVVLFFNSCFLSDTHREEDKIFHAAPPTNSVAGELYFGLYKDNTYQICSTGGLGQDCYSGKFKLNKDTLTLLNLKKDIPLKSNRLLIIRYVDQDSNYWKSKYPNNPRAWQDLERHDTINGLGDVYQLDNRNKLINGEKDDYFIIRLDDLKSIADK